MRIVDREVLRVISMPDRAMAAIVVLAGVAACTSSDLVADASSLDAGPTDARGDAADAFDSAAALDAADVRSASWAAQARFRAAGKK